MYQIIYPKKKVCGRQDHTTKGVSDVKLYHIFFHLNSAQYSGFFSCLISVIVNNIQHS